MSAKRTLSEKYETKVVRRGPDACWGWNGAKQRTGHGLIALGRTSTTAHRVSWMLHHGDPSDLYVLHACDNPPCTNPNHLYLGTHRDNMRDAVMRSEAYRNRDTGRGRRRDYDVALIRERVAAGESQQAVADDLGIGQSTVSRIVRGEGRFHSIILQ